MTLSVTVKNNGPYRANVNEVERLPGDEYRTAQSHTLEVGQEVTLNIWGIHRHLTVLETDDGI